jgi:hypothetical protein
MKLRDVPFFIAVVIICLFALAECGGPKTYTSKNGLQDCIDTANKTLQACVDNTIEQYRRPGD